MLREMINSGYFGYITEAEGVTSLNSSRTTKINSIIKDFKSLVRRGYNPNNYIHEVLTKYGLNENLLTDAEIRKINGAINGTY
jgi:hypothetical protein